MDYEEMMAKGRALLDKHGLHDWRFDVQNLNKPDFGIDDLGGCDHDRKLIVVDWRVGRQFRQTVLHEIAHALANETPEEAIAEGLNPYHGKRWLKIAEEIGCTYNRLSEYY